VLVDEQNRLILRTDNGGEYTPNKFEKHLEDEGIRHERTVPKTPEENGVAERLNRTLVESARSTLLDANLSSSYWAEAVSTAAYLKNHWPTRKDTYDHVPKDEQVKFDSKQENVFYLAMVKKQNLMMSLKRR
jgi:transposase InsO family protein